MTSSVMTVRGAVPVDEFGFCLPHEHTFIDLPRIHPTQLLAYDFQLIDQHLVTEEVRLYINAVEESVFAAAGRPMLVELTTGPLMGRDPTALRKLSADLDLHVVMGCGWYREPWFDPGFERLTVRDLERQLLHEIEHGVDGVIRPGIIGELGADRDFVSPAEERVLRAGARAHKKTGLTITLHARGSRVALSQIETLREEGVDPARIIAGHADSIHDPDYHEELARIGVWVEFDTVRGKVPYTVERSVRYISEARRRGYLDQLLLSSDNCALSHLQAYGGSGYGYLPGAFTDSLRDAGFSDEELKLLFIENPKRALTGD
jgi:predicted metal-dependent phosphotriesterase family hydrolase